MPAGRALVVAPDGTVLADSGREEGLACAWIDPDAPYLRPLSHGMPEAPQRDSFFSRRRPELYGPLTEGTYDP